LKTILLITTEPQNRLLYERGLKKHFQVVSESSYKQKSASYDAIILDIPQTHKTSNLEWLKKAQCPVIVLTPEDTLPLPISHLTKVLTYPVEIRRLLKALEELGVKP
jgi:DNA-binding response OmpR family regulator